MDLLLLAFVDITVERKEEMERTLHDELVAEKAFEKLYEKLEANGEFKGQYYAFIDHS